MSKPRLPKVWVVFRGGRSVDSATSGPKPVAWSSWHSVHRYAPVQKPKVCRWTQAIEDTSSYHASCGEDYVSLSNRAKFCYCCGGKIKETK